ncbi:hypothetical protein AWENTII_001995 [Aspergillus wentii]
MAFSSLPAEVHQRIIHFMLSNRDVANLSVQCRSLHSLCDMATRKKYDQISITGSDDSIEHAFNLLMDIIKRPSLGQFMRHIEHSKPLPAHAEYVGRAIQRELPEEDMQLLENAVHKAGFTGHSQDRVMNMLLQKTAGSSGYRYLDNHSTFITQALTALLITVSPNLISMAMTQPFFNYTGYYMTGGRWDRVKRVDFPLDQLLRQANANPDGKPYLQNLRKVYMINKSEGIMYDERFYHEIDFIGCCPLVDRLPSIEWIGTDILGEDENGIPGSLGPSNISRISITDSSVGSAYLARLITPCKALKEFRYSIGGRSSLDGYPRFNPKAFIHALGPHKTTLEILHVDVEARLYQFTETDGDELEEGLNQYAGPAAREPSFWDSHSLKEFTALKQLALGIGFLLYFARGRLDNLPDGLEQLTILGYKKGENKKYDAQVDTLAGANLKVEGIDEMIPNADDVDCE